MATTVWRRFTKLNVISAISSRINYFSASKHAQSEKLSLNRIYSSFFHNGKRQEIKHSTFQDSLSSRSLSTSSSLNKYYVKPNYLKKCGRRDMKRRQMFKEHEVERTSLRMIKKSDILPSGVRQKAAEDLHKLPLNSSITRVRNRCVLTDRGRGLVGRFRVSRMMFRYFAEKGLIAGVQKAQW